MNIGVLPGVVLSCHGRYTEKPAGKRWKQNFYATTEVDVDQALREFDSFLYDVLFLV